MERIDRQFLLILGFSSCTIEDARLLLSKLRSSLPTVEIQLMRADYIAGKEHLWFATDNAVRAFGQNYRRSRSLEMEILLYASGQRQISKAIALLGVSADTKDIAVVGLSKSPKTLSRLSGVIAKLTNGRLDPSVMEIASRRKLSTLKKAYGITAKEVSAAKMGAEEEEVVVKRLVIEKSALLAVEG